MSSKAKVIIAMVAALAVAAGMAYLPKSRTTNDVKIGSSDSAARQSTEMQPPSRSIYSNGPTKTMEVGKAFTLHRSGDFRPRGDAGQWIDLHRDASERGNADATYQIYLTLNECISYIASSSPEELAWAKRIGANDRYEETIDQKLHECIKVDSDMLSKSQNWLSKAAAQGSIEAQILYASNPDKIIGTPIDKDSDAFYEWRSNAISYLNEAISKGSVDALMTLSNAYRVGFTVPADPTMYYGLEIALNKINHEYSINNPLQEATTKLTQSQLRSAKIVGDRTFEMITR